ncbi:MAG: FAD-dependent oxidoreductase [Candidatus Hydrogenedentes bacterium]|nr:FAD-dependent oxidoreductase [Candidatus Hydrogenedentota bacterium]
MRIAIVGGGISGLVAAYQLQKLGEVSVFEANDYMGGHTHTVDVPEGARTHAVDTGFIVYNDWTYPNFIRLLDKLNVATQPSDMSFALSDPATGFAYAAPRLSGLFAYRRNALSPSFYRMLWDIARFSKHGPRFLEQCEDGRALSAFFEDGRYSRTFLDRYLVPMISAIWSAGCGDVADLPARYFLHFFKNHGLMNLLDRPQWRVITGGSRNYIAPLIAGFRDRVYTNSPVRNVTRNEDHVALSLPDGEKQRFDHVVLALHSDQALRVLSDPSDAERDILGAIPYQPNDVVLHTDTAVLPGRRNAWASWNYRMEPGTGHRAHLTYHMNRLQSLDAQSDYLVSLNQTDAIAESARLGRFSYSHPAYSAAAVAAQQRHAEISGVNRTHYCGAYWGYGFHEDGVKSALQACAWFGRGELQ